MKPKIVTDGDPRETFIFDADGNEIKNVAAMRLDFQAGKGTTATLACYRGKPFETEVNGQKITGFDPVQYFELDPDDPDALAFDPETQDLRDLVMLPPVVLEEVEIVAPRAIEDRDELYHRIEELLPVLPETLQSWFRKKLA